MRVTVAPGESKLVDFPLGFNELSFFNVDNRRVVEPADYTGWIGGSSTAEQSVKFQTTARPRSQ
jgi:beta-glucosidase